MIPFPLRLTIVISLLCTLALLLTWWSLTGGTVPLTSGQIFSLLTGNAQHNISLIVLSWRLPRIVLALLIGAALGVSGAIFQSLLRNPLGSPDIIGFNAGAWSGVLVALVFFGQQTSAITFTAMAGGIITSVVVWGLTWRNGITTFRLIIVGIAVRAMLMAFNTWLLLQASLENAISAGLWHSGSLNGLSWEKAFPAIPVLLLALLAATLLVRPLRLLEMGDDSACALGVSVERSRLLLMLIAVILTAGATALSGPVSFIALVAPHIARRLTGTARLGLLQAALCGGVLLLLADLCAQRLFQPYQLPAGLITVSLGGIYLIALLIQESRKQ